MQFFRFEGLIADNKLVEETDNRRSMREKAREISAKTNDFNRNSRNSFIFTAEMCEGTMLIGVIAKLPCDVQKLADEYTQKLRIELKDTVLEEITFHSLSDLLERSSGSDFIKSSDDILERFELDNLDNYSLQYGENVIDISNKKSIYADAEKFFAKDSLIPELDRIYAGSANHRVSGHPVHYMIQTDDLGTRKNMCRLLVNALYSNNRINSRRYCFLDLRPTDRFSHRAYDDLYKSCAGGTIIVRYLADESVENDHANVCWALIEFLCEIMKKYCNQVLTVFCLPRECTKSRTVFYENLGSTSIVELKEEFVYGERAAAFLKMLAKDNGIRTDRKLFNSIEENKGYLAPDLHNIFDEWYNLKLKTTVYPQYRDLACVKREVAKAAPKGSAYAELNEMIGLTEAKKVINRALNYYKAQKLFADKGMKTDNPSLHMVFTGNPGTAKTSVARLFAAIMKENNMLSKGDVVEVGRGDLVGQYVGWTAPTIQKKFREASGSVLFIDEAYSLVDDRDGSFGDEAINTIVQEMENHRDDVVVIFAGYPDKMETFLQKNPGLRSRIAYHVPFEDYNTDELCRIAELIADKKGLTLTEDALAKLNLIFEDARMQSDFGNGRFARNIIEKAKMAQATRLLEMDFDSIKSSDITTLCAEDIELPAANAKTETKRIGFCA